MRIAENFILAEFNSKCGRKMPNNVLKNIVELAKNLQVIRNEVKLPVSIASGYRSPEHNAKVKGARNSQHLIGTAADIKVQGMSPLSVSRVIERLIQEGKIKEGGIGIYNTWVHYDIRGTKARWDNRKIK
jgi:uncharacterized protein YcbK (DUF882 family)